MRAAGTVTERAMSAQSSYTKLEDRFTLDVRENTSGCGCIPSLWLKGRGGLRKGRILSVFVVIGFAGRSIDLMALSFGTSVLPIYIAHPLSHTTIDRRFPSHKNVLFGIRVVAIRPLNVGSVPSASHGKQMYR